MASTFGERLKSARISKNFTQKELAEKVGAKHNSISGWENDKNKPDPDTIELLCGVLGISPNYLLGSTSSDALSPAESLLIKKYRALDEHGKDIVNIILEKEYIRSTASKVAEPLYTLPYAYDLPASAGSGEYAMDIAHFKTVGLSEQPPKGTSFLVRIAGDSMEPKFSDGDKVFVKREPSVDVGEIGLFYLDENVYIKKMGIGELLSLNPKYKPIPIKEFSSFKCFGKILGRCEYDITNI